MRITGAVPVELAGYLESRDSPYLHLIPDTPKRYGAAIREILLGVEHRLHKRLNNQAENSHHPTRWREKNRWWFKSARTPQRFLSAGHARYTPSESFQTANVPVTVTGVGFFDFLHGQAGVAPNGIELHAVLDVQFSPSGTPTPTGTPTATNLIPHGDFEARGS
jgi:hypothetical protein